jgi:hypothetical protein
MGATIGIAAIELVIRYLRHPNERRIATRFAAWVFLSCVPVFGLAFWAAFHSDYLGKETVSYGMKAQGILRMISQGEDLAAVFMRFIVPVIGWWWFCAMAFCLILFSIETMTSIVRRQSNPTSLRLAGCVVLASLAIFWWLFLAGTQHRYLFPFILMTIIWLLSDVIERISNAGASLKSAIACYSVAPAFLLIVLLWSTHPPISLQRAMGINLSTGQYASEVQVGSWLITEAEKLGRPVNIYSLGGHASGVIETIAWMPTIENENVQGTFKINRPLNWVDTPGLRIQEIAGSDFLLLENIRPANLQDGGTVAISTWPEEVERFKQFAYFENGVDKNGLDLVTDGSVKVLRVVDKSRFADALHAWAKSIRWENDFTERNVELFETPR